MRARKHLMAGAALVCAGLLYGYVLLPLGLRIPCPLRRLTGLRCPGCGVTDLCLDLLHGHLNPAHNWGLVLVAPWIPLALWLRGRHPRGANALACGLVAALLAWGLLRNLSGI